MLPAAGQGGDPAGRPRRPMRVAAVVLAAGLGGAAALLHATAWGVGVSPDSVRYLDAARHLAAGKGLSTGLGGTLAPLTHFPPLYPLLVAPLTWLGPPEPQSLRWLNAALLVTTVGLVGGAVFRASRGSAGATTLAAALTAAHPGLFRAHAHAWSEPPFVLLALGSLLLIAAAAGRPGRRRLAAAGLLAGLSVLARYAGLSVIVAGSLGALLGRRRRMRERAVDGLAFLVPAAVPVLGWGARTALVRGTPVDRDLLPLPLSAASLRQGAETLAGWLYPPGAPPAVRAALLAAAVVAAALLVRRARRSGRLALDLAAPVLFLLAYPLVLLVSLTLFDPFVPLDARLLAPAFPVALVVVAGAAGAVPPRAGRVPAAAAAAAGLALLGLYVVDVAAWAGDAHRDGLAFTARVWRESPTLAAVERLDPERVLFTNGDDLVYFHTGRVARPLPVAWLPEEELRVEVEAMGRRLRRADGRIAWFDRLRWRSFQPTPDRLRTFLPLEVVERFEDGVLLRAAGAAAEEVPPGEGG